MCVQLQVTVYSLYLHRKVENPGNVRVRTTWWYSNEHTGTSYGPRNYFNKGCDVRSERKVGKLSSNMSAHVWYRESGEQCYGQTGSVAAERGGSEEE